MADSPHEYVSIKEFARRIGTQRQAVQYAIQKGRIELSGKTDGTAKLIDWTTESIKWEANRRAPQNRGKKKTENGLLSADFGEKKSENGTSKSETKVLSKKPRKKKENFDKLEKHIGDSEVYETGQMGIDPSFSRFDSIPDIDNIQAPVGSVAYYQAKKIAIDALRNLNKLKIETGQLISVPDAISLYGEILTKMSDVVQTIPSRISSLIVANIKKSVEKWRTPPENLEAEIFRLLTIQVKNILADLSKKLSEAEETTQDFIDETVAKN